MSVQTKPDTSEKGGLQRFAGKGYHNSPQGFVRFLFWTLCKLLGKSNAWIQKFPVREALRKHSEERETVVQELFDVMYEELYRKRQFGLRHTPRTGFHNHSQRAVILRLMHLYARYQDAFATDEQRIERLIHTIEKTYVAIANSAMSQLKKKDYTRTWEILDSTLYLILSETTGEDPMRAEIREGIYALIEEAFARQRNGT